MNTRIPVNAIQSKIASSKRKEALLMVGFQFDSVIDTRFELFLKIRNLISPL